MSTFTKTKSPSKPVSEMTKIEMEQKIKGYRFVLAKLHKEIEEKDEMITKLTNIIDKYQRKQENGQG